MGALRVLAALSSFFINFMIVFNFVMVIGGVIYSTRRRRRAAAAKTELSEYPTLSVIVPARNEEFVIRATALSLLNQDYPADRYEIIIVNDNSTDGTANVLRKLQDDFPERAIRVVTTDEKTGGKGKSSVLNMAFEAASGSLVAVYDADNTPEPDALRLLVCALMKDDRLAAVTGKFRTRNRKDSLLTRLIDKETLISQSVFQSGFWQFFKASVLPGTNFVIRRSVLEEFGGWNVNALIEDTEFSYRLLAEDKLIKFIPEAVTWEQEPARFRAWLRQRNRWARGNISLVAKSAPKLFKHCSWRFKLVEAFMLSIYVMLFCGVLFSDLIFIGGLTGLIKIPMSGLLSFAYRFSWIIQLVLYFAMAVIAIWQEKEERTVSSALMIPLLLFGYAKFWIVIIICAVSKKIGDKLHHRQGSWDKTEHLAEKNLEETVVLNQSK